MTEHRQLEMDATRNALGMHRVVVFSFENFMGQSRRLCHSLLHAFCDSINSLS